MTTTRYQLMKAGDEFMRLRKELKKARAQAAGMCDGCGMALDDAFCTKCLHAKPGQKLRTLAREVVVEQLVAEHVGTDNDSWIKKWHALMRAIGMTPRCRRCGCTQRKACKGGCSWVAIGLCSKCENKPDLLRRKR